MDRKGSCMRDTSSCRCRCRRNSHSSGEGHANPMPWPWNALACCGLKCPHMVRPAPGRYQGHLQQSEKRKGACSLLCIPRWLACAGDH